MSKHVFLSGYYGFDNFGDDLVLDVLTQHLTEWGYTPVILSAQPRQTAVHTGGQCIHRSNLQVIWHKLTQATAFISGGGSLFQDRTGLSSPLYYGGLIMLAWLRKRPIACFSQGIGPLTTGLGNWATERAFNTANLIIVRDKESASWVSQHTQAQASIMADPVWLWEPSPPLSDTGEDPPIPPEKQGFGISLRPWGTLSNSAIEHLATCLSQMPLVRQEGVNLINCQSTEDMPPLGVLEKHLKDAGIECRWFANTHQAEGIMQSRQFIGMRFHALAVAAKHQIPAIGVAYDPKVTALCNTLDMKALDINQLETLTPNALERALKKPTSKTIHSLTKEAEDGFTQLKQWLDNL